MPKLAEDAGSVATKTPEVVDHALVGVQTEDLWKMRVVGQDSNQIAASWLTEVWRTLPVIDDCHPLDHVSRQLPALLKALGR